MANPAEFDFPDGLAKIVDDHISEMFPEEMHADVSIGIICFYFNFPYLIVHSFLFSLSCV